MNEQLPTWLNPYQLMAWVRYRDVPLARQTETATQLAALTFYDGRKIKAGEKDVTTALQESRLVAYGAKPGQDFVPIPAIEWTRLRIAPQSPHRFHPYVQVSVRAADVLKIFPHDYRVPAPNRQLDYDEIKAKAKAMREQRPELSIGSAAASIVAELPPNPRTKKQRDHRHIERLIAPLWKEGD